MKPIEDLDDATAAAVTSVKVTRERTTTSNGGDIKVVVEEAVVEVRLSPKTDALNSLGPVR